MGFWSFYFLGKLYLYFRGFIRIDFILNILFIGLLIIPIPKKIMFRRPLKAARFFISLVLALLLLWHDSWLPPLFDSMIFLNQQGIPSKEYVYRFIMGFFNPREVAALSAILAFFILLQYFIRLTPLVIIILLIVPIREFGQPVGEIDRYVDSFYKAESARIIRFEKSKKDNYDFDIVILHVCSLSWDDMKEAGLEDHPIFKQFDYLFTNFNSVTSYSNPSAIRLLRANCGQQRHDALYNDAPKECNLLEGLRAEGYETYFALNHDGIYGDFAGEVKRLGHLDQPFLPKALPVQAYSFDGAPIYDNYTQLERIWKVRQESNSKRTAIYYNTISLHDGVHWAEDKDWWKKDKRMENYKEFAQELLGDITRFFDLLRSSERDIVVLFVPEHGMALRGSSIQAPVLRDIPLPQITRVPVGIKLIRKGSPHAPVHQQVISGPTSYLSLSYMLKVFLEENPFETDGFTTKEFTDKIPQTDFAAENQGVQLTKKGTDWFLYGKEKQWIAVPANAIK
ncbi:MAG: cellulose biosynthesis protein BcsG [Nitrospirota bacterium]